MDPAHNSGMPMCWPGWLSLSVSSAASFISSWGRKNERRSRGEKRRGSYCKIPLTTTSHCAYCPQTRLTSHNNTTKVHVSLKIVNTKGRHLSQQGIFLLYFSIHYVPIKCWKISHLFTLWILTKCHYMFPAVTDCLQNVFIYVLATYWLLLHAGTHKSCDYNKDE